MKHYRTVQSLKKKLDEMELKYGKKFTIDHGIANYAYDHYQYNSPCSDNAWTESITLYVVDFWNGKVIEYMTLTDRDLRKPTRKELEWCYMGINASWEKEFPTILEIREYEAW